MMMMMVDVSERYLYWIGYRAFLRDIEWKTMHWLMLIDDIDGDDDDNDNDNDYDDDDDVMYVCLTDVVISISKGI